jgi:poly(A) polymerase
MKKAIKIIKQIVNWHAAKHGAKDVTKEPVPAPKSKKGPTIIGHKDHRITRGRISDAAFRVMYRLHKSGHAAYLVGGSVRDVLLGLKPKDFDVVTDALPEQVRHLFGNSIIIGKRFRLVHVRYHNEVVEVATFRGPVSLSENDRVQTRQGLLIRDNVYGTSLEDDVWRRDFTVNGLYYNAANRSVIDYTGGMEDLKLRQLRMIGDPEQRYREDPARMLRAVRLAAKLDLTIEPKSAEPISFCKKLLLQIPPARLFDKMLKIFHSSKSFATYQLLRHYSLFSVLFPATEACLSDEGVELFIENAFKNSDKRVIEGKKINSGFLFSVLLWPPLQRLWKQYQQQKDINPFPALELAMQEVLQEQLKCIGIPRRFVYVIRDIWTLQYHLQHAKSSRIQSLFRHDRFRAAYDFLELRVLSGETSLQELYDWWTQFQSRNEKKRIQMIEDRYGAVAKKQKDKKKS